jgi:hypothetical protein
MGIVLIVSNSLFLLFRFANLINVAFNTETNNLLNPNSLLISTFHAALEFDVYLSFNNVYRSSFIKLMKKMRVKLKITQDLGKTTRNAIKNTHEQN